MQPAASRLTRDELGQRTAPARLRPGAACRAGWSLQVASCSHVLQTCFVKRENSLPS